MRIGVDWGGTKIEIIAIDSAGNEILRRRVATPLSYGQAVQLVCDSILELEQELSATFTVGIGIPGTISPDSTLVKNANSTWLNGKPLKQDLERLLAREIRIQNDANCFAVSEAVDGAGAGHAVVAGLIIGTGCGCGIAIEGRALSGKNAIAGEFGHVPLPWMTADEYPGLDCWCGKKGCLETYVSGTGFARDFQRRIGGQSLLPVEEILKSGGKAAQETLEVYYDRLARCLALIINTVDPDIIVLGGGMSNVSSIYSQVPPRLMQYVFSDVYETQIVPAKHGDSSGVRGAAWLW